MRSSLMQWLPSPLMIVPLLRLRRIISTYLLMRASLMHSYTKLRTWKLLVVTIMVGLLIPFWSNVLGTRMKNYMIKVLALTWLRWTCYWVVLISPFNFFLCKIFLGFYLRQTHMVLLNFFGRFLTFDMVYLWERNILQDYISFLFTSRRVVWVWQSVFRFMAFSFFFFFFCAERLDWPGDWLAILPCNSC